MEERLGELFVSCASQSSAETDAVPKRVAIENIVQYVQQQGLVHRDDADHFHGVLQTMDNNGDGAITLQEFQRAIEAALSSASTEDSSSTTSGAANGNSSNGNGTHSTDAGANKQSHDAKPSKNMGTPTAAKTPSRKLPPSPRMASVPTPRVKDMEVRLRSDSIVSLQNLSRPPSRDTIASPAVQRPPSPERVSAKVLFDMLDKDGKGYISRDELVARWGELGKEAPLPPLPPPLRLSATLEDDDDVTAEDLLEAFRGAEEGQPLLQDIEAASLSKGDAQQGVLQLVNGHSHGSPRTTSPARATMPHINSGDETKRAVGAGVSPLHTFHQRQGTPLTAREASTPAASTSGVVPGSGAERERRWTAGAIETRNRSFSSSPAEGPSPALARRTGAAGTPPRRSPLLLDAGVRLLRSRVENLTYQLADKDQEVRHLKRELVAVNEALHQASDLADAHIGETENELQSAIVALEERRRREVKDLEAKHAEVQAALRSQISTLKDKNAKLSVDRDHHIQQIKELHVDRARLLADTQTLRNAVDEQHRASAAAASDLDQHSELVSKLVDLQAVDTQKTRRIQQLEQEASLHQEEISSLKSLLEEARARLEQSTQDAQEQRWEPTETLAAEMSRMDASTESQLRDRAQQMQLAAESSEKRVSSLLKELESVRETKTALEERAGRMLGQLRNLVSHQRSYIAELENELASKKLRLEVLSLELELSASKAAQSKLQRTASNQHGVVSPYHPPSKPQTQPRAARGTEGLDGQNASQGKSNDGRTTGSDDNTSEVVDNGGADGDEVAFVFDALASPATDAVRIPASHLEKWLRRRRERRRSSRPSRARGGVHGDATAHGSEETEPPTNGRQQIRPTSQTETGRHPTHTTSQHTEALANDVHGGTTTAPKRDYARLKRWMEVGTDIHQRRCRTLQALQHTLRRPAL